MSFVKGTFERAAALLTCIEAGTVCYLLLTLLDRAASILVRGHIGL